MRPDGFAPLPDVSRIVRAREDHIRQVCCPAPGDKPRFELMQEGGSTWIRATHGHSDPRVVDCALHRPIFAPLAMLVHGTHSTRVDSILSGGLWTMGRRHIHFVDSDSSTDIIRGFRSECNRLVYVDMANAILCGMEFYRAPDGMVVTPGFDGVLPPRFIKSVCDLDGRDVMPTNSGEGQVVIERIAEEDRLTVPIWRQQ